MDKYIDYYNDSKKVTYHEQTDISNILKLRAVLKTLPDFCKDYFRAMDPLTTTKTRISYAYDIRIFFQFLLDENPAFKDYSMKDFTVDVLDQLKAIDIEEYQEYLKVYKNGDKLKFNYQTGEIVSFSKVKEDTNNVKIFNGVHEGKTKFIKKTIRGGQSVEYPGNIIIIGDVNSGAEVSAGGNIIVLGSIRGNVKAGAGGNNKSIIAAFSMQPELMQISDILTTSPDDGVKPSYPEVAKIRDGYIVVEPYLPNKYIY